MRGWRAFGAAGVVFAASVVFLALVLDFLAPDLSYQIRDRTAELLSGRGGRKFRIALGAAGGSSYRAGTVLNRYLNAKAGYELELVVTASPGNVAALLDPNEHIDLAVIRSADDEGGKADGVFGLAALESQYFFVMVPNESTVHEFRDLAGAVNPGEREAGQPETLGERVLDYYGLLASPSTPNGPSPRVSVVRPTKQGIVADFESGQMIAATRTQPLHSNLIEEPLREGRYRLVPVRDNEALARSIPGTKPGLIPPGLYGPGRRIPSEPVPTLTVTQLLVARGDLPGRVVRDILDVIYHPRFARDVQYELSEESGRKVGGLRLHPAAEIYYHRNDLLTSDRLGRLSFVASAIAALAAGIQFITRFRRSERVRRRRRLLGSELAKLEGIRHRIEESPDAVTAQELIREADDLLSRAEQDAAAGLLDTEGIQSLRSLHQLCWRALEHRRDRPEGSIHVKALA
jgi:TRAP-type uncharacterized transport system substrate-binding protein